MFQVTFCKLGDNARLTLFPTLLFLSLILLGQSNIYAQQPLELKIVPDIYQNTDYIINLKPTQALMLVTASPVGPISEMEIFTYTDIRRNNFDYSRYQYGGGVGRYYNYQGERKYLSLIDDQFFYVGSNQGASFVNDLFPQINSKLRENGLGTLLARQNYISFLSNRSLLVSPTDFRGYLQPWIIVGLVIAILIPAWYLMRRFLR